MAVSLPSDIVMDVVQAASPVDLKKAHADLIAKAKSVSSDAVQFQAELSSTPAATDASKAATPVGEKFEAMVMQVLLQSMLPADMEQVYGSGLAGDMWKSMLAEKIAASVAKHGQLGIASNLLKDVVGQGEQQVALSGVTGMQDVLPQQRQSDLSNARLQELQRSMLKALDGAEGVYSPAWLKSP